MASSYQTWKCIMHGPHEMVHHDAFIQKMHHHNKDSPVILLVPGQGPIKISQSCSLCLGHFQIEVMRLVHGPSALCKQTLHPAE